MHRALWLQVAVLLLAASCSDDTTVADKGPAPDQYVADHAVDAPVDLTVDAPVDAAVESVPDGPSPDGVPDVGPPDQGLPDLPVGTPAITGTISRSVAPLLDAKGTIFVGVYNLLLPPPTVPMASVVLQGSNLATTATKINYSMYNIAPGSYTLWAFLDDNTNAGLPFLIPDQVDLVMTTPVPIKVVAGQPLNIDLVLDALQLPASDGGMGTLGALKGMVTSAVSPSLDGKGTMYISLHTQLPPQGQVAAGPQKNADLSSPFAQEAYYLGNVQPGQYYLRVFLDDNGNAAAFNLAPDTGDLVSSSPVQVHVSAGVITSHNVVLDKVQP